MVWLICWLIWIRTIKWWSAWLPIKVAGAGTRSDQYEVPSSAKPNHQMNQLDELSPNNGSDDAPVESSYDPHRFIAGSCVYLEMFPLSLVTLLQNTNKWFQKTLGFYFLAFFLYCKGCHGSLVIDIRIYWVMIRVIQNHKKSSSTFHDLHIAMTHLDITTIGHSWKSSTTTNHKPSFAITTITSHHQPFFLLLVALWLFFRVPSDLGLWLRSSAFPNRLGRRHIQSSWRDEISHENVEWIMNQWIMENQLRYSVEMARWDNHK